MTPKPKPTFSFLTFFEKFIAESKSGRRLQPNGKRISSGTLKNYTNAKRLLEQFSLEKAFSLRLRVERSMTKRELDVEKHYWKKFYRRFTDFLYDDLGHFDNYVGSVIKVIKTFFGYVNRELALGVGTFYKQFYTRKEEIAIYPLMPEELNFLIYDREFEGRLPKRLKEAKDVFVFGCTVALRVSDLLKLKRSALRTVNQQHYLAVRSQKTSTDTLVKLPPYAVDILKKYTKSKKNILPAFNHSNLNDYIKTLLEAAGFTHSVARQRQRRGKPVAIDRGEARFCDVASTHTMRRTAITTMLCLGMPEQLVRKISGHAPGTKEFYRYVFWAQAYQDGESEKVYRKLSERTLTPCA